MSKSVPPTDDDTYGKYYDFISEEFVTLRKDRVAYYSDAVKRGFAKMVSDRIDFAEFNTDDLPGLFRKLKSEGETAQVLVLSSLLEDKLSDLIQRQLPNLQTKSDREEVFSGTGPLSTFSNRLKMCYFLGWLSQPTYSRLNSFRRIRNAFAHGAYRVSFEDAEVSKHFPPLFDGLQPYVDRLLPMVWEDPNYANLRHIADLTLQERVLCALAVLVGTALQEMLLLPVARHYGVNPKDVQGDKSPKNLYDALGNMLSALYTVLEREEA